MASTTVKKSILPRIDLGLLLCEDSEPLDEKRLKDKEYLKSVDRDNIQLLVNDLFQLPPETVDDAVVVPLPSVSTTIPREKPLPAPRAPTKWEEYAKAKGIQNRKKSRLVWDEVTQTWKPRYGYRRAENDKDRDWVHELPSQKDAYADTFAQKRNQKRERTAKNQFQNMRNKMGGGPAPAVPTGIGMTAQNKSKDELARQIDRSRQSTASAGKFTNSFKDEKAPKNKGKKHRFQPNEMSATTERTRALQVLQRTAQRKVAVNKERAATINMQMDNRKRAAENREDVESGAKRPKKANWVPGKQSARAHRQQFYENVKKGKTKIDPTLRGGARKKAIKERSKTGRKGAMKGKGKK